MEVGWNFDKTVKLLWKQDGRKWPEKDSIDMTMYKCSDGVSV